MQLRAAHAEIAPDSEALLLPRAAHALARLFLLTSPPLVSPMLMTLDDDSTI